MWTHSSKGSTCSLNSQDNEKNERRMGLTIVVFTDCDPWSFRIFASIAYGAIKTAHISEYLATPSAIYLGIDSDDIKAYDLPSDELTSRDIEALKAEKVILDSKIKSGLTKLI